MSATAGTTPAAIYLFDERRQIFLDRCDALGMNASQRLGEGTLTLDQIEPGELSPGEFAYNVCQRVDQGCRVVMIDSLNGYQNAMPMADAPTSRMHELLGYLSERGVATMLVAAQHGMIGAMVSPLDISYLADCVVMLRFFEARRLGTQGDLGDEEAHRRAREHDSGVCHRSGSGHESASHCANSRACSLAFRDISANGSPCCSMAASAADDRRHTVLVFAPVGRDGPLTRELLERAAIDTLLCNAIDELCTALMADADAVILTEEALDDPVVLDAGGGARSTAGVVRHPGAGVCGGEETRTSLRTLAVIDQLRNVTLIERPIRLAAV